MKISTAEIIRICDNFLLNNIDRNFILTFSERVVREYLNNENERFFENDVVKEVIFDWDNHDSEFPINDMNIKFWKHFLLTGEYRLPYYNNWDNHITFQQEICVKYNSDWKPFNKKLIIGLADNLNLLPLNGLRHLPINGTSGWYIWGGEYNEDPDFFKPVCADHLLTIEPKLIKFLGLEPGFRFLTDNKDYEDVWFDEKIIHL